MESACEARTITFEALQDRLARLIKSRVSNGEFTERGLARMAGISQPQMHNFLKGARKLSPDFADRLMLRCGIGILDLFDTRELAERIGYRPVADQSYQGLNGLKKPARSAPSLRAQIELFA